MFEEKDLLLCTVEFCFFGLVSCLIYLLENKTPTFILFISGLGLLLVPKHGYCFLWFQHFVFKIQNTFIFQKHHVAFLFVSNVFFFLFAFCCITCFLGSARGVQLGDVFFNNLLFSKASRLTFWREDKLWFGTSSIEPLRRVVAKACQNSAFWRLPTGFVLAPRLPKYYWNRALEDFSLAQIFEQMPVWRSWNQLHFACWNRNQTTSAEKSLRWRRFQFLKKKPHKQAS